MAIFKSFKYSIRADTSLFYSFDIGIPLRPNHFYTFTFLKKNIAYIISSIDKALAFEWIAAGLNKEKFRLVFILLNPGDSELERYLRSNFTVYRIPFRGNKDLPKAIVKIYRILKKENISVIHSHLFAATLGGMVAARLAGVKKRIYSRHHASFHHEYFPAAVKYDRFTNFLSTDIVAVSKNVKEILVDYENVPAEKIHIIHHGFDLDAFREVSAERITAMKRKYLPESPFPVIGLISRYIEWKGVQYVIPAFAKILTRYPRAHLILANARGYYEKEVRKLLEKIPRQNYTEIAFEGELFTLYKLFDVFVHVPVSKNTEAFGQTYVEALVSGIPSVFTLSGVAPEFIKDRENALVVDYKNSDAIYNAITELLQNESLRNSLIVNGQKSIEGFALDIFIKKLEELYSA